MTEHESGFIPTETHEIRAVPPREIRGDWAMMSNADGTFVPDAPRLLVGGSVSGRSGLGSGRDGD